MSKTTDHKIMAKPDYQKEITDSLKEGAIITTVTIGEFMILKYVFKVSPPSAKLDINDAGKLFLGIVGGVLVKDYAVDQKWINPLQSFGKIVSMM